MALEIEVSPSENVEVSPAAALSADVTGGGTLIVARSLESGASELVYDGNGFMPRYASSIVSDITGGQHFEIRRIGGWFGRRIALRFYECSCNGISYPAEGLVQLVEGDSGLVSVATRVSQWTDQSPMAQHLVQTNAGSQPYTLADSIDDVQLVSFGAAGDANKELVTATNFVDRNNTPMDGASARTILAVVKPRFDAAWGITGGIVWKQSNWQALFDLEDTFASNGAHAWSRAWRDHSNAMDFTPVTGGAGGSYNGAPTLLEWRSAGSSDLVFKVNNVVMSLSPGTLPGSPGGASAAGLSSSGSIAFLGAIASLAECDYDLSTTPAAYAQAYARIANKFPSVPLVF